VEDEMLKSTRRFLDLAGTIVAATIVAGCQTQEGVAWPAFNTYRLPYADGTTVSVSRDFTTHEPEGRYDLNGQGGAPYSIVAAADGWIRFIVDDQTGHGEGDNNYVWIEHPNPYCQPANVTWPGKPADYAQTCIPCSNNRCNEWTKYSHMATGTTTDDAGLSVGDWVTAGTFLGIESDIGHATGSHLHWQVTKINPDNPIDSEGFAIDWTNDGWLASPDVLPSICGIGILYDGDSHVAAPCPMLSRQTPPVSISLLWQAVMPGQSPTTVYAAIDVAPRGDRITIASFRLLSPAMFASGVNTIRVEKLRLVRPTTIRLSHAGSGEVAADQLIWSATVVTIAPNGGQSRRQLSGPIRGRLTVTFTAQTFQLSLDAEGLGHISGAAAVPQPVR
jgi:hypothetical protein